ncbi:MAG: histidine phosphatase family protein [Lachnospiraceae bacterium]|nr:histidine phosphatase family protein [Lachnospiraceae bacterium]
MKLYLIRHAESYGNIKGKIISATDFELTEKGIAQSQRIGQNMFRIERRINISLLQFTCQSQTDAHRDSALHWTRKC